VLLLEKGHEALAFGHADSFLFFPVDFINRFPVFLRTYDVKQTLLMV